MSKKKTAVVAFTLGFVAMYCVSIASSSRNATALAQGVAGGADLRPAVGTMPTQIAMNSTEISGNWRLDGINCTGCVFENATLTYWGGPVRCEDCVFKGNVTLEAGSAAYNTMAVWQWFQALAQQKSPEHGPLVGSSIKAQVKGSIKADLWTPDTDR